MRLTNLCTGAAQPIEGLAAGIAQPSPRRRQLHAAADFFKQADAQFFFQCANLAADRTVRYIQLFRSLAHAFQLRCRLESP